MKPSVKLGAKDPRYAFYGHVIGLVGSALLVIFGILSLLSFTIPGLFGLLIAIFVLIIKLDVLRVDALRNPLKSPMFRGIVWIVLAVIGSGFSLSLLGLAALGILVSGILYILYAL